MPAKPAKPESKRPPRERHPAERQPIARVLVDLPLAHLDRPFDYQVDADQDAAAVPGCRVKVRFAGQLVTGYLLERTNHTDHTGRLTYLDRVVSSEPVLTPELAALARAVADRYAGTVADVLRLAIPPRHARVEAEPPPEQRVRAPGTRVRTSGTRVRTSATRVSDPETPPTGEPPSPELPEVPEPWRAYERGPALLSALAHGTQARAVWQALPGEDWPSRLAEAAATVSAAGRGVVIVAPDYRDVARLHTACVELLGAEEVVALSADLGPAERYRRWLRVRRGTARVVVGTRAAMFAPVAEPGLFVVWDDGDDLHAEQRAPYPHVRDVLTLRAHTTGAGLLIGGFARTAEAQLLVQTGWAHAVAGARATVRERAPRVTGLGDDFELARDVAAQAARLPALAFEAARAALTAGAPVLVHASAGT